MSAPATLAALLVWSSTATALSPATVFSFGSAPEIIVDADADTIADPWELRNGLDPANPADATIDLDGDGLNAQAEYQRGGDPWSADSDRDGTADGQAPDAGLAAGLVISDTFNQAALFVFCPGT